MPDTRTMQTAESAATLREIGLLCLAVGLLGYTLAARAIGGTDVAYRDQLIGFVVLTVVSGALLALIGRRFWRARPERTLLSLGVRQALFGLFAYVTRSSVHG